MNFFANGNSENAIPVRPMPSPGANYNVHGSTGCAGNTVIGSSGFGVNLFANPAASNKKIKLLWIGFMLTCIVGGLDVGLPLKV